MSNQNVSVKVRILGLATELRDKSDHNNRPGRDGSQRKIIIDIPVLTIPWEEWVQRVADAETVLRYGNDLDNDKPPSGITDNVVVTGSTTATVYGTAVLTQAIATTMQFERDTTEALTGFGDMLTADESPISDIGTHSVHSTLIGLTPNTRYAYRLVVANATGTKYGLTKYFKTDPTP